MDFGTYTSCNPDYKPYSFDTIMNTLVEVPELPPKKKLPVYLDGELKGYLKVRIDCLLNPDGDHEVLECPRGFSAWMGNATFGEIIDDLD